MTPQPKLVSFLAGPALWFCACNLLSAALSAQCTNPTQVPNQTISSGAPVAYTDPNALSSSAVVVNGSGSLTLTADKCIQLLPGFDAKGGTATTTFLAFVTGTLTVTSTHNGSFIQGATGSYTVSVSNAPGAPASAGNITVTENLPSGLSLASMSGSGWTCASSACTRSDSLAGGTSYPPITVNVDVAANASSPQINSVMVSGSGWMSNAATDSTTIVPPPDFSVSVSPTVNPPFAMAGGNGATYTVTVVPNLSFVTYRSSDSITLTANVPTGFTATFGTTTGSTSSALQTPLTITAPAGSVGNIAVSVTATDASAGIAHTVSGGTLAIQDFTVTLSPSYPTLQNVTASATTSATASWTLTAAGINGFAQPISLYADAITNPTPYPGCPSWAPPGSITPGTPATVNVTVFANTQNGYQCSFTVEGLYGGAIHRVVGALQANSSSFSLNNIGSVTASAGGSTQLFATYNPVGAFSGAVNFSLSGLPAGATYTTSSVSSPLPGAEFIISVPAGILPSSYTTTVTAVAQSGCTSNCTQIATGSLTVSGGQTFSVTAVPTTATTVAPGGTATYNVSVTGSYTGFVNLTTSGGPPGASIALSSYTAQSNGAAVTLTIATTSGAPLGNYATVIAATTSAGVTQYASAPLTVGIPTAAAMLTPGPGANIAGGSTTFTWNSGIGATQYTITATPQNGQPVSATTGQGQLSATLSLPSSSQTLTVTLQTATAPGPLTQTYTYTIQPPGTAQPLTLAPGNPTPAIAANGQEYQYTFVYQNPTGAPRPSPEDICGCVATEAIKVRIIQLTANTATLGFTATGATPLGEFDWECDNGTGPGGGGTGPGTTSDPTPNIDSITPPAITAGTPTQVTISGENFGQIQGVLSIGGTGGCSYSISSWSGTNGSGDTIQATLTAAAPGYCTVAVAAATDDRGNPFAAGDGSSPESTAYAIPVEPTSGAATITLTRDGGTTNIDGTSQTITIGQYVTLDVSVAGASGAVSYQWTMPGNTAVNWTPFSADPPSTTGQPIPVPSSETTSSEVSFAWTSTAGGTISVQATLPDGTKLNAVVTFKVTPPNTVPVVVQQGVVLSQSCPQASVVSVCLYSTDGTQGMTFGLSAISPGDQFEWVQVVNSAVFDKTDSSNNVCEASTSGLDGAGPLPSSNGLTAFDSPGVSLNNPPYIEVKANESFTTFLMYMPQNGIWAPLYQIQWGWSADAALKSGAWSLNSSGTTKPSTAAASSYPTWGQIVNPQAPCNPQQ